MLLLTLFEKFRDSLVRRWVACRIVSDKESVRYGIYFSYPVYIVIVLTGVLLQNPFILLGAALIAFLGIKLPLHPFDYIYNHVIARLIRTKRIPGRGSELQVNSMIALVFNLVVFALITFEVAINYEVLAIMYAVSSVYFIGIFLFKD